MFRFFYISSYMLIMAVKNTVRIWCSWCSIADFSSACTGSSPVIRYLVRLFIVIRQEMFGRIVLWLVIMGIGWLMVYYSAKLVETFWRSRWADEHLWWTKDMWVLIWFWAAVIWWLITLWIISFADPTDMDTVSF